jgi:2-oxoisovalerate dehydrogenase E1 component beta subunit
VATKLLIEAIREGLFQEMDGDERVIVLGEDVGKRGGVFRVTDGLMDKFGEMRVIDSPLAESSIVGVAIGAAVNGLLPIAEIQFIDFILPAVDQIVSEAAKFRYRSAGDFNCPIVIRTPYGGGIHGALYHSQSLEAMFTHIPGLKVVAPVDPYDAKGLLRASVHDPDPVIFLEHKRAYRAVKGEVPDEPYEVPIGKAKIVREGSDLTIVSYGWYLQECIAAAEEVAQSQQVSVEIIDLRTLRPLDTETILTSVMKTGKALIVHEANKFGGLGGEISAIIAEEAFAYLDGPIVRLAGPEVPAMPYSPPLEKAFISDKNDIRAAIEKLAAY